MLTQTSNAAPHALEGELSHSSQSARQRHSALGRSRKTRLTCSSESFARLCERERVAGSRTVATSSESCARCHNLRARPATRASAQDMRHMNACRAILVACSKPVCSAQLDDALPRTRSRESKETRGKRACAGSSDDDRAARHHQGERPLASEPIPDCSKEPTARGAPRTGVHLTH